MTEQEKEPIEGTRPELGRRDRPDALQPGALEDPDPDRRHTDSRDPDSDEQNGVEQNERRAAPPSEPPGAS